MDPGPYPEITYFEPFVTSIRHGSTYWVVAARSGPEIGHSEAYEVKQ